MIDAGTQRPKISFCAVADTVFINNIFSGMECDEVTIQATGTTQIGTLELPFVNETSRVGMEITTKGIKADFMATRVDFYGICTMAVATTGLVYMYINYSEYVTYIGPATCSKPCS